MVNLDSYLSHPNKKLLEHIREVVVNAKILKTSVLAEVCALFHDIGKLNPNFQKKINPDFQLVEGRDSYSNHAYLSAYCFLCYCAANDKSIQEAFGNEKEWLGSALAIIAHHHGDLPNFEQILKDDEYSRLISFLNGCSEIPAFHFLRKLKGFFDLNSFEIVNHRLENYFQQSLQYKLVESINNPLDYFLETQFAFDQVPIFL